MVLVSARPERLDAFAAVAAAVAADLEAQSGHLADRLAAYAAAQAPRWVADVGDPAGALAGWAAAVAALGAWTGAVSRAFVDADATAAGGVRSAPEARVRSLLAGEDLPTAMDVTVRAALDRLVDAAVAPESRGREVIGTPPTDDRWLLVAMALPFAGGAEVQITPEYAGPATEVLGTTAPPPWVVALVTHQRSAPDADDRPPLASPDEVFGDPATLTGRDPVDVLRVVGSAPGWEIDVMQRGRNAGRGLILQEYTPVGATTDRRIQWHPGGGHHGDGPYWKVSSGITGTVRVPA